MTTIIQTSSWGIAAASSTISATMPYTSGSVSVAFGTPIQAGNSVLAIAFAGSRSLPDPITPKMLGGPVDSGISGLAYTQIYDAPTSDFNNALKGVCVGIWEADGVAAGTCGTVVSFTFYPFVSIEGPNSALAENVMALILLEVSGGVSPFQGPGGGSGNYGWNENDDPSTNYIPGGYIPPGSGWTYPPNPMGIELGSGVWSVIGAAITSIGGLIAGEGSVLGPSTPLDIYTCAVQYSMNATAAAPGVPDYGVLTPTTADGFSGDATSLWAYVSVYLQEVAIVLGLCGVVKPTGNPYFGEML